MQTQDIYGNDSSITQFNNYTLQLCEIVASYYLVKSVTDDNTTSSLLRDLDNTATATLKFWASIM